MQNKGKILFVIAILVSFLVTTSHAAQFAGWEKMDLRSRQFVEKAENKDAQVKIIIKTVKPVKWSYKRQFKKVGFKYRSIIKNIVTGSIEVSNINKLAGLEFVERIELAIPLDLKR